MHSFEPAEAVEYGILEAVLLSNIRWWVTKNASNNKGWHEGHYWTYNSAKAFAKMFPYASQQQIQRALKKLESLGAIHVGCYNTNPYDHTKWYTTPIEGQFDRSHLINQEDVFDQPSNTDSKPVVNKKDDSNPLFDVFWKAYPRKTNKGFAKSVFKKLKVTDQLLSTMLQAIEAQKKSVWKDKEQQYIPHPSTWLNGERWEDEVQSTAQQPRNPFAGAI